MKISDNIKKIVKIKSQKEDKKLKVPIVCVKENEVENLRGHSIGEKKIMVEEYAKKKEDLVVDW